jgi:hypothetical protein
VLQEHNQLLLYLFQRIPERFIAELLERVEVMSE